MSVEVFSIQEIITTWKSVDFICAFDNCPKCRGVCRVHESSYCFDCCPCTTNPEVMWSLILDKKRRDYCYYSILDSIQTYGLVGVLAVQYEQETSTYIHLDGHHRLAVMIDLGFTNIPYLVCEEEMWYDGPTGIGTGFREDIITRVPTRI